MHDVLEEIGQSRPEHMPHIQDISKCFTVEFPLKASKSALARSSPMPTPTYKRPGISDTDNKTRADTECTSKDHTLQASVVRSHATDNVIQVSARHETTADG